MREAKAPVPTWREVEEKEASVRLHSLFMKSLPKTVVSMSESGLLLFSLLTTPVGMDKNTGKEISEIPEGIWWHWGQGKVGIDRTKGQACWSALDFNKNQTDANSAHGRWMARIRRSASCTISCKWPSQLTLTLRIEVNPGATTQRTCVSASPSSILGARD